MKVGIITIEVEGFDLKETDRLRKIIHSLLVSGGLNIIDGKTILNWSNRNLMNIKTEEERWKRKKLSPLDKV